jgi:hypothetical protein
MVLNTKKSKIRQLKEQIQTGTTVSSAASKEQRPQSKNDDEDGSNSTDYVLSDEEDGPGPSLSKVWHC